MLRAVLRDGVVVMLSLKMMAVSEMGVMMRLLVMPVLMGSSRLLVMMRRLRVMFGRLLVMFSGSMLAHFISSTYSFWLHHNRTTHPPIH